MLDIQQRHLFRLRLLQLRSEGAEGADAGAEQRGFVVGGRISSEKLSSGLILTMVSRWARSTGSSRKPTLWPVK